ncbi:hypothetical protein RFI_29131, partial [Reticulomyxa filosa]
VIHLFSLISCSLAASCFFGLLMINLKSKYHRLSLIKIFERSEWEKKSKKITEGREEVIGIKVAELSFAQCCFNKSWLLQLNSEEQVNHFVCCVCKEIANEPLEINCPEHEDMDGLLIAGEHCLKQYLDQNKNGCPVQCHDGCKYIKNKVIQRHINDLNVICPRQFQQDLDSAKHGKEGEKKSVGTTCNFKGKIKDLNDHLKNTCPLKLIQCWFKSFGCNYLCLEEGMDDHLISNMKFHFDLVMKQIESLQQTTRHCQKEKEKRNNEKYCIISCSECKLILHFLFEE